MPQPAGALIKTTAALSLPDIPLGSAMIFSVHVLAPPYSRQANQTALQFCRAVLRQGHQLKRVFFSGDGVLSASQLGVPPQDEINLYKEWIRLNADHGVELVVCISACLRRGMVNVSEAERYQLPAANLSPSFVVAGLGQLVDAALESDRLVTFGA